MDGLYQLDVEASVTRVAVVRSNLCVHVFMPASETCISHAASKFNRRLFVTIFASIIVTKDDTKLYIVILRQRPFDEFIAFSRLQRRTVV